MRRRLTGLLLLQLIFGAAQMCVSAQPGRPAAHAEPDPLYLAQTERELALERSDREFLPFAGQRIGRIRIKTLAVFGASIDDTSLVAKSRILRFLNRMNFATRETTIRSNLLFKEGDTVDPLRLADSERILRRLAFIGDARIVVTQDRERGDIADLLVIVKESWTLELSGSLRDGNHLKIGLAERDLLGLGHQVSGSMTYIPGVTPRFDTSYSLQNIRGSFITGELDYADMSGLMTTGLSLSRPLVSPILRYVGGLNLRRTVITVQDSLPSTADNSSDLIDLWAGRQFHLGERQTGIDHRRALLVSGRIRRLSFTKRPPVTASTYIPYHDASHVLGSLALIQSRYYRTGLLYDYGRTEDIPYGFLARVTCGLADEEFSRSAYASATMAAGEKIKGLGYGAGELRVGGNPKGGKLAQGVLRIRSLYFSNLLRAGSFRLRQFLNAEYTTGIHRTAGSSIGFSGNESIRGVVYDGSVIGTKRLQLNFETVAFTPWKAGGIACAFFTFADLDFIGSGHRSILAQKYYSGLGLGVRLHTDTHGIGPIQLRFAWYPRLPIDHRLHSYTAFGEKRFQPIEFVGNGPEIVEY
jgi:hypothetical protein